MPSADSTSRSPSSAAARAAARRSPRSRPRRARRDPRPGACPAAGRSSARSLGSVSEAAAGALDRRELAQPVRMALDRQVQRRVGRMQVPHSGRPIGQPFDPHRPEHRLQRARVTGLDPPAPSPLNARDLTDALLPRGPQRQMIRQQPAQQLARVRSSGPQDRHAQPCGIGSVEKAQRARTADRSPQTQPGPANRRARCTPVCSIAIRLPAGQDLTARR